MPLHRSLDHEQDLVVSFFACLAVLLSTKSLLVLISVKPNGGVSCPVPSAQWKRSQGRQDAGSPSRFLPFIQFTFCSR